LIVKRAETLLAGSLPAQLPGLRAAGLRSITRGEFSCCQGRAAAVRPVLVVLRLPPIRVSCPSPQPTIHPG